MQYVETRLLYICVGFGCWSMKHVTYLKLRKKQPLIKAEQMHKMKTQLFHSNWFSHIGFLSENRLHKDSERITKPSYPDFVKNSWSIRLLLLSSFNWLGNEKTSTSTYSLDGQCCPGLAIDSQRINSLHRTALTVQSVQVTFELFLFIAEQK